MRLPSALTTRMVTLAGAAILAGSASVAGAGPAAASTVPWSGALCTAAENIQFWNGSTGATSYTVQRGEFIRVDRYYPGYSNAEGHGSGHSTRWFYWRHTNGASRVHSCH
jgi:hypothetical protein